MAPASSIHMNHGEGEASYARNSSIQSTEQKRMAPLIEDAIASLCSAATLLPSTVVIADLGCSCGPNALVLASTAVDAVRRRCVEHRQAPPEVCVILNDLPGNDFNAVAKSMAAYQQSQESSRPVLTGIVPGSFYGRLFGARSVHLLCSSASLHWLSQAPEYLVRNKIPFYDMDEVVQRARRPVVIKAYTQQFEQDFTMFLGLRAQELVPGGRMVFSVLGRRSDDTDYNKAFPALEFTASVLLEMASMGLIQKEKVDSFYVPMYGPTDKQIEEIVEAEGSFSIDKMAVHENAGSHGRNAKTIVAAIRSVLEPIILQHFGSAPQIMSEFVRIAEQRHGSRISHDPYFDNPRLDFVTVSLARRI